MGHKILFVDDERSILNAIRRRIGFDYNLDIAESGQLGLDAIQSSGPYNVIFTDMRMPKMDGLQFIKNARELTPDSLFVMLTGNNDCSTADNAVNEGGVYRFLRKPCAPEELKVTIEECLQELERREKGEAAPADVEQVAAEPTS